MKSEEQSHPFTSLSQKKTKNPLNQIIFVSGGHCFSVAHYTLLPPERPRGRQTHPSREITPADIDDKLIKMYLKKKAVR